MKTKGLPYQTVQFQYAASCFHSFAEDCTMRKEDKLIAIEENKKRIIAMAEANAIFWANQCEDSEFCKKE